MKTLKPSLTLLALLIAGSFAGCSNTTKSADVTASIRTSLDQANLKNVSVSQDREKRLRNDATKHMAKNLARNLVYYAQLLKQRPLVPKAGAA